jgi:type I restriction enzyme S subunit
MKKGWEQKPFESCIEPVEYTRKVQRKDFLLEGQFPIVSQEAEFTNGFWDDEADLFKLSKPVVVFGDHTQVLKYVDFDFVLGADGVKILQPRNFLWPKFFFYQLQAAELPSLGYARHYRLFKELEISVPPLAEQQRIVGVLDEAFAGLATAQAHAAQNLQNARALFESHLQSVFTHRGKGWVEKRLAELCDIQHGYAFDGAEFSNTISRERPIIITPGNFTEEATLSFTDKNTKRFSGTVPEDFRFAVGDLVVVMTDLSSKMKILGKPAFVESLNILHNQRIGRFVFLADKVERRFVYYFLRTEAYLKEIRLSATGTMVKHTAPKRILSALLPFPPNRAEQKKIVTQLDALAGETQRLTRLYEQKQAALAALKKSLLHQAFTGEL